VRADGDDELERARPTPWYRYLAKKIKHLTAGYDVHRDLDVDGRAAYHFPVPSVSNEAIIDIAVSPTQRS
jgi:hypothetical protein